MLVIYPEVCRSDFFLFSLGFIGLPGEKGERGSPGTGIRGQRGPNGPPGKTVAFFSLLMGKTAHISHFCDFFVSERLTFLVNLSWKENNPISPIKITHSRQRTKLTYSICVTGP